MFATTFYYSRPVAVQELPYVLDGETLEDRVQHYVGNFFYRLPLFLRQIETIYGAKVERCALKGSVVPLILGLAKDSKQSLNDIDIQITLAQNPLHEQAEGSAYMDSEKIRAIHQMALDWLQLSNDPKARPPRCQLYPGFSNIQLKNPSTEYHSPIDFTISYQQPNSPVVADAISTKDGLEIAVHYLPNGEIDFQLQQNSFISQFASMQQAIGLYKQRLFAATAEHMEQIQNGLLFIILNEIKGWVHVTKAEADDPTSELYIKSQPHTLKHACFAQFLKQHQEGLGSMKLAHTLERFVASHLSLNSTLVAHFLSDLLSLAVDYAKVHAIDRKITEGIVKNIASCVEHSTSIDHSSPQIKQLKRSLHFYLETPSASSLQRLLNEDDPKNLDVAPPFFAEPSNEDKEPELIVRIPNRHPLYMLTHLADFVEQIDSHAGVAPEDQANWLIHLLFKSSADTFDTAFKSLLEKKVNKLLTLLKDKEKALELAYTFANFVDQPNQVNSPKKTSRCVELITHHIVESLSQSGKKKKTQLYQLKQLYRCLSQKLQASCLTLICKEYTLRHHPALGARKAHLLLHWIQRHQQTMTLPILQTADIALRHAEEWREIFITKVSRCKVEASALEFWNQIRSTEVEEEDVEPPLPIPEADQTPPEPIVHDPVAFRSVSILLQHAQDLIQAGKSLKALEQLNKLQVLMTTAAIGTAQRKELHLKIKKCKQALHGQVCAYIEKNGILNPQEVLSLSASYRQFEPTKDLTFNAHLLLSGEYATRGDYALSILHLLKSVHITLHSKSDAQELQRAIADARKMFVLLNTSIQQTATYSAELKTTIDHLNGLFNVHHLKQSIGSAIKQVESLIDPIAPANNCDLISHHDLLCELAALYPQCESGTYYEMSQMNALNWLRKALSLRPSENLLLKLSLLVESIIRTHLDEEDKQMVACHVLHNAHLDFPTERPITGFNSPALCYYLGTHFLLLTQHTATPEQTLFASLLLLMALKMNVHAAEKLDQRQKDAALLVLYTCFSDNFQYLKSQDVVLAAKFFVTNQEMRSEYLLSLLHSPHYFESNLQLLKLEKFILPHFYRSHQKPRAHCELKEEKNEKAELPTPPSFQESKIKVRELIIQKEWLPALRLLQNIEREASKVSLAARDHTIMTNFLKSHRKHIADKTKGEALEAFNREQQSLSTTLEDLRFRHEPKFIIAEFEKRADSFTQPLEASTYLMLGAQYACEENYPASIFQTVHFIKTILTSLLSEEQRSYSLTFACGLLRQLHTAIIQTQKWPQSFEQTIHHLCHNLSEQNLQLIGKNKEAFPWNETLIQLESSIREHPQNPNIRPESDSCILQALFTYYNDSRKEGSVFMFDLYKCAFEILSATLKQTFLEDLVTAQLSLVEDWQKDTQNLHSEKKIGSLLIDSYFQSRARHRKTIAIFQLPTFGKEFRRHLVCQMSLDSRWEWSVHAFIHLAMACVRSVEQHQAYQSPKTVLKADFETLTKLQQFVIAQLITNKLPRLAVELSTFLERFLSYRANEYPEDSLKDAFFQNLYNSLEALETAFLKERPICRAY